MNSDEIDKVISPAIIIGSRSELEVELIEDFNVKTTSTFNKFRRRRSQLSSAVTHIASDFRRN